MSRNCGVYGQIFYEKIHHTNRLILCIFRAFSRLQTASARQRLTASRAPLASKKDMFANASLQAKSEQFELYVKKFRSLFEMHNIRFGSPEDFPSFMQGLTNDRHFAMDFWALAGSLSRRKGGELSVDQILAVIVDSVAGVDVATEDEGLKTLTDELAGLLAGVDLYSTTWSGDTPGDMAGDTPPVDTVVPPAHTDSQTRFTNMTKRATDEVPVTQAEPAFMAYKDEPTQSPSPVSTEQHQVATAQHQLDEALMRLELNSLELKEHIDDLDRKMSRIEPHLEALASKVYLTERPERSRGPIEEPVFERPIHRSTETSRIVLEPREEPLVDKQADLPASVPLGNYAQRSGNRGVAVFVVLLLLIAGGVVLAQRYGPSLWQRYGATVQEKYNALLQKAHATQKTDSGTAATDKASAVNPPPIAPASTPATSIPANIPEQNPPPVKASSSPEISSVPQAEAPKPYARSVQKTRATSEEATETAISDQPFSSTEEANAVKVAPAVMEANLVASRVPVYPEKAKAEHIEGPVLVQALISKDGFVDRVHVVQGDSHLRNAAAAAVQRWRFRPYLLNGQPVEVATVLKVDFKLDQ